MGAIVLMPDDLLAGKIPLPFEIESFDISATKSPQGEKMEKPSLDDVLLYGKAMVGKAISELAYKLPKEQQEEIEQEAYLRLIKKYPEIEAQGWKSLTFTHCKGAALDYMKHGKGFKEDRWSIQKAEEVGDIHAGKLQTRVSLSNSDEEDLSIDQVAGANGVFDKFDIEKVEINWELLARLASQDECLHAFAKSLRGITLEKMAPVFGVKTARAGQMVQAFIDRFDDPEHADCPWFKQCCFALGISEHLGLPRVDQSAEMGFSVGWNLPPVDLDSTEPHQYIKELKSQMSFLDGEG